MATEHVIRGYLGKLGATKVLWAKRWCALSAPNERTSASFEYYKSKDDETPLHSIELSMYDTVEPADETGRPHSFKIRNSWDKKAREYFFAGDSETTAQSWIDAIKQVFSNRFQVSHFERMRLGDTWLHNAENVSLIGGNVKVKTDLYSVNLENHNELPKLEKERKQLLSGSGLKEAWCGNSPTNSWNLNFFPIKSKDSLRDLIFSVDLREIDNINYDEGKTLICIILRAKSTEYFFYIAKAYKDYWLQKLSAVCNSYKQNVIEQTEQRTLFDTQPIASTSAEIESQQSLVQIPQLLSFVAPETVSPELKSPTKELTLKTQSLSFNQLYSNQTSPLQAQQLNEQNPTLSQTQQMSDQNTNQSQPLSPIISELLKPQSLSFTQLYSNPTTIEQPLSLQTQPMIEQQQFNPIIEYERPLSQLHSPPLVEHHSPLSHPTNEEQQFFQHTTELTQPTIEEQLLLQPTTELAEQTQTQQTVNEQTSPQFTTTQTHVRPPAPKNPPRLKRNL